MVQAPKALKYRLQDDGHFFWASMWLKDVESTTRVLGRKTNKQWGILIRRGHTAHVYAAENN